MLQHLLETGLRQTMNRLVKPALHPKVPVSVQRTLIRQAYRSSIPPRDCRFQAGSLAGTPVIRSSFGQATRGAVLYLHGGGYIVGSAATHKGLTGHLAKSSGCMVVTPDYRLAPEHPFPAALDDAEAAWRALINEGFAPGQIAIAGDSAGGGLTIARQHMLACARGGAKYALAQCPRTNGGQGPRPCSDLGRVAICHFAFCHTNHPYLS